jgi:hypothetical protein
MSAITITLKESVEFDRAALTQFSKRINKYNIDKLTDSEMSNKISAIVSVADLSILKRYVDHHAADLDSEKKIIMKPIKVSIHKSIDSLFAETDPWDGKFLSELTHDERVSLMRVAEELILTTLINKISLYLAFFISKNLSLSMENPDKITGQNLVSSFKKDLNIDLPNMINDKAKDEITE